MSAGERERERDAVVQMLCVALRDVPGIALKHPRCPCLSGANAERRDVGLEINDALRQHVEATMAQVEPKVRAYLATAEREPASSGDTVPREVYESAVRGRQDFRNALRMEREMRLDDVQIDKALAIIAERDRLAAQLREATEALGEASVARTRAEAERDRIAATVQSMSEQRASALSDKLDALAQLREAQALVHHAWLHAGYPACGRAQMTTEQKSLFDSTVETVSRRIERGPAEPAASEEE